MEALNAVERIIRDLLVFVVAMSVVLAALLVIISRMPNDNPLKRILVALSLSRRRDGGGRDAGHSGDPDPRPRRGRRHWGAARPHLVLVDFLPRRAPRSGWETSALTTPGVRSFTHYETYIVRAGAH